ncbi:MAG: acyl dehydratase [Mycobacterium sp.]|nr:acyl dehydratase [Mycobacterium sp.]
MKWEEIAVPCDLPETVDEISYERVIMNAGTTWDYIPWHFDPEYARNHGHPTIFVNTMHLAGFIDRIATAWAGPYSRVVRRKVTLVGSIYAGDSMVGRGRVIDKRRDGSRDLVDLELAIYNQRDELCCPAEVTLDVAAPA